MPATSGVITTPDILIVKLLPDSVVATACQYVVALMVVFFTLQTVAGVRIISWPSTLHSAHTIHFVIIIIRFAKNNSDN